MKLYGRCASLFDRCPARHQKAPSDLDIGAGTIDLIIKNARLIDGTGGLAYDTDIAVEGDRITAIGHIDGDAAEVIDATGAVVTPGFIDLHCHSDGSFLIDPHADSKLRQGVTLELMGNCGMSFCAPLAGLARAHLDDWMDGYETVPDVEWTTMDGYLNALEACGPTVNVAAQVGHGTVRQNVLGMDARSPDVDELAAMERLMVESLDAGALGFSTGLFYTPGSYSVTDEVVALAQVAADRPGLMTAYEEALEIGRRTGVRVELSHVKCKGVPVWGKGGVVLALIEAARREGLDVAGDQYPYSRSSTLMMGALFPKWAQEGGRDAVLERIKDSDTRAKVRSGIDYNIGLYQGPEAFTFSTFRSNPDFEGRHLGDIAIDIGVEPSEAALRLFEMGSGQVVLASLSQEDVDLIATSPFISVASDGNSQRTEGPLSAGWPHPRSYGTNARFINEYVNAKKTVTLENAVHRMTGLPAQRLDLKRRGRIAPGYIADIVIMRPEAVRDNATFTDPHQYAEGVDDVWVNGTHALKNGTPTGKLAGKVIRSKDF